MVLPNEVVGSRRTMMGAIWPLLTLLVAAHGLKGTNTTIHRALGKDAENHKIRKAPPLLSTSDNVRGARFRPGEILVSGSPLDLPPGIKVKKYLKNADLTVVKVTPGHETELVKRLKAKGRDAEENFFMYASSTVPNDTYFQPYQWHMAKVQALKAWEVTTGKKDVIVAVLDTGVADDRFLSAEEKKKYDGIGCIRSPYNAVNNNKKNDAYDRDGHGTHVAGTIGQKTNNGLGGAGLAHGCCIMPVKVLADDGSGDFGDIAEGIRYAVNKGAKVINLSLGVDASANMRRDNGVVDKALQYAYSKNVVVVAAAGNEAVPAQISYPAIYPTVIAVGAVDFNNKLAYYSNSGDGIDIVAPGGDTYEDLNGDGYGDGILQETFENGELGIHFFQGTSMACPHVAAAAALLISAGVATTPDQVKNRLQKSAKDLGARGFDKKFGHGLLQVHNALIGKYQDSSSPPNDNTGSNNNSPRCWTLNRKAQQCKQRKDCRWRSSVKKCRNKK